MIMRTRKTMRDIMASPDRDIMDAELAGDDDVVYPVNGKLIDSRQWERFRKKVLDHPVH
jgi:hypothetical protein